MPVPMRLVLMRMKLTMARSNKKPVVPMFYPPKDMYEPLFQLEILGHPPRKSNSRQIVINRKTKKPMIIKSKAALNYVDLFAQQVPGWAKQCLGGPDEPLFLLAEIYYRTNASDISVELIKDLLQKNKVIRDDRYVKAELLFGRVDKDNPRTILTLYRMRM